MEAIVLYNLDLFLGATGDAVSNKILCCRENSIQPFAVKIKP